MRMTNEKKTSLSEEDQALFRQLMTGTRQITHDTIVHRPQRKSQRGSGQTSAPEQADNNHYFQMSFSRCSGTQGAVKYVREDVSHFELKNYAGEITRRSCSSICMG